ncbi:MAG: hypothetical protein QM770_00360 [Tepidisphaeraceae bacterium]
MLRRSLAVAAASVVALLGLSRSASAQHANFVLFGSKADEAKTQAAEDKFVMPVTDPYFHESSFVTSDVRAWAIYHSLDSKLGIDHATVYAAQVRLALTDDIQLVAYKDGYTDFGGGYEASGYNDIGAGLKWNFLHDYKNNLHAAAGLGYELALGDPSVLSNDDEYRAWVSVDKGFGKLHLGAVANLRIGDDNFGDADVFTFHGHVDYYVNKWFSPVAEINYYVPFNTDSGLTFGPADVANLDSHRQTLNVGVGAEIRPMDNLGIRAAFQVPVGSSVDVYGWRCTLSAVYSF